MIVALLCGIRVNVDNFKSENISVNFYNTLGKKVSSLSNKVSVYTDAPILLDFFSLYGMFTGVNRGSAFFCPNVGFIKIDISLTSNGQKIPPIYTSVEGQLRMETYWSFLTDIMSVKDHESSKKILEVLGKITFIKNKSIDQIDARMYLYYHPKLKEVKETGKIEISTESFELFTICKA